MHKELKRAILNWLLDNEFEYQRVNACKEEFNDYIYKDDGSYLIGGDEVVCFIRAADKLLYSTQF